MKNIGRKILNTFLRKLTNLTGNNRSLLLLRLSSEQLIDLHELSFLAGEHSFALIEALIANKAKKICPVLDSRMEAVNVASRKLKRLARINDFIFEERGSRDLHVGWPIVRGKFSDGTLVRAPLLFFPVSLAVEADAWKLSLRKEAGITFNKSFILAYSYYNGVEASEELLECSFEEFESESVIFRTQLYQLLSGKMELNFNRENFGDELNSFVAFTKKEFEELHRTGELKLFPEAVLGIFPQSGSQLVPDYLKLIEDNRFQDLEEFFASRSESTGDNAHWTSVKEEKIYTPFHVDVYQENAIRLVKNRNSIVVQGPPGTGKSQLICNILADSIASGKKALLVCQKKVALDVVCDRLQKMELADFLGLVHDFRNDRKNVFEKIARQVETIEDYRTRNRSVDVIHLERRFFHVCRQIDSLTEELEEFRKWLFDESECGLSVKELYLTSDPGKSTINIRQEYQHFDFRVLHETLARMRTFVAYAAEFDNESHPWKNRKSFANLSVSDLKEIESIISNMPSFIQRIQQDLSKIISTKIDLEDCLKLHERQPDSEEMISLLKTSEIFEVFVHMSAYKDDDTSLLWLQNMERVCMNCFDDAGVESSLTNTQLGTCQAALHERMRARRSLIRMIRWELFSEHKFFLKRVLINNDLFYNKQGLKTLERRIDNRQNLEHHLTALKQHNWLVGLPSGYDQKILKEWFQRQLSAVKAKLLYSGLRELRGVINLEKTSLEEFNQTIRSLFAIISAIPFHVDDWRRYLTAFQVRALTGNIDLIDEYLASLRKDFDKLCEFDRVSESIPDHEMAVIGKLHENIGEWKGEEMEQLFDNSVRLAWIEHIEAKHPVLRTVSTHRMNEMQEELQRCVIEKLELSKEITLLRAREHTYESIEYNRLNNPITYRDLLHQVTKKRKIWPIRKVVGEFSRELFNLIPCWLASPESVSAIFPMEELFDIVIFDEASQCFSERGIPAMYRGRQVVVAGDDMQLKPFELYQARWEEEGSHPDEEVDSLLELTKRYLPSALLQGHYRSESPQLIDFSNAHFYDGKLKLLPDYNSYIKQAPFIDYLKVDGVWENQTNHIEALAVVSKIKEFLVDSSKGIGVVTFNAPQQELIQDILEEEVANGLQLPKSFFVKNIENVQGDEKDIIIFSIAYARDSKGKMNMQFGSLNVIGGENRLNVAITRAREKIVVITSIWPEEMKTENVKNDGPKLLRSYLVYARSVSDGKHKSVPTVDSQHSTSWYLNDNLTAWGNRKYPMYSFVKDSLPFASSVLKRERMTLGILLTDDDKYLNSVSVKEHHAYIPELLQQKKWRYQYLYSRRWWANRSDCEESLTKFVYQADTASKART